MHLHTLALPIWTFPKRGIDVRPSADVVFHVILSANPSFISNLSLIMDKRPIQQHQDRQE